MQDWVVVVFTGVIAVATCLYTFFTHRLWKEMRFSTDIARYTAFANYLTVLGTEIEKTKKSDPKAADLLSAISSLAMATGVEQFLKDIDFDKNKEAKEYFESLASTFTAQDIDPMQDPLMGPILRRLKPNPNR